MFFGTPDFAVPTLERLLEGPHTVVAVVSQPDRRRGRGRRVSPSPVAEVALRAGLPLLRPERVGASEVAPDLSAHAPDLGVVVAFGQFLPRRIRELPAKGYLMNGHASLLPLFRGAAPIARAILAGESVTGVSAMRVEREMDAGPVACARALRIGAEENAGELTARMAELTAAVVADCVDAIADDRVVWTPQDDSRASFAPKLDREDARLRWEEPADALVRRVRAMAPTPGAHTGLEGETLRILAARALSGSAPTPGTVQRDASGLLRVATGAGWLVPLIVQRPGGKPLPVDAYLRGRPLPDGARFR